MRQFDDGPQAESNRHAGVIAISSAVASMPRHCIVEEPS
jgi:hypothetical protein